MGSEKRWIILIVTSVIVVGAIVVAIAVPLSKRADELTDEESMDLALQYMTEAPLIDG